jgi:hypothetical protein
MMQEFTVDHNLESQLGHLAVQTILCDQAGRILGFFSPVTGRPKLDELQLEPPLSIEETEKLRANKTEKPLSEILAKLSC